MRNRKNIFFMTLCIFVFVFVNDELFTNVQCILFVVLFIIRESSGSVVEWLTRDRGARF